MSSSAIEPASAEDTEPRPKWKRFVRSVSIGTGLFLVLFIGFYLWQPMRIDLFPNSPPEPLNLIPVEQTGLFEPSARVLVLVAHPDDEVFYISSTLRKLKKSGVKIFLASLTSGDKAYYPFSNPKKWGADREAELSRSAELLGAPPPQFFRLKDSRFSADEAVGPIRGLLEQLKPTHVLAFDGPYHSRSGHRDHRNAGIATVEAIRSSRWEGLLLSFATNAPNTAVDAADYKEELEGALAIHKSQFNGNRLAFVRRMVEGRAKEAAGKFGLVMVEPLRASRWRDGNETHPSPARP